VAKRGILLAGIDLNNGATTSFHRCKAIYEAAGGPKFTVDPLVLTGSYVHESAAVPERAAFPTSLSAGKCFDAPPLAVAACAPPPAFAACAPPPAMTACARPSALPAHLSASAEIGITLAQRTKGICADALEMAYG
jgi:hypothetical protein